MRAQTTYAATHNPVRAAMWMLGTIASFSAMAVAGREVSFQLDTFEIMMYRSFIGFVTVLIVGRLAGTLTEVRTDRLGCILCEISATSPDRTYGSSHWR